MMPQTTMPPAARQARQPFADMKPVAILGAGLAGLVAARELKRRGIPVILFEAAREIGGLAGSYKDADGFSYDMGAHFVSNRLARELGAEEICRTVTQYGEAVRVGGQTYGYPFGLLRSPRYVASALAARLEDRPVRTAADWFTRNYGAALAQDVAIPLAEAWSGARAEELAPSVGEKMRGGMARALMLKAAAKATRRAVCIGYSHEMPESPSVYHVYPEGGIARLLELTAREVGETIRLNSPVEAVIVEGERVTAVRVGGETIPVSAAISTAPVTVLPKLIKGSDRLSHLAEFRYRPMIFVNLRFSGRNLLPDTMLWVPDRSQPFFRLTEAPRSMPWLAPEGKTLITFDIGCDRSDAAWSMSDAELAKLCLDGLARLDPALASRSLGLGGVLRTPIAYPVYLDAYENDRKRFGRTTGIAGLYSIGRNGEFAHILMEDIYWRSLRQVEGIEAYLRRPVAAAGNQGQAFGQAA